MLNCDVVTSDGCAEQYNLDRMDAEEDMEDQDAAADETEINSNLLINLPRDQQQNLITADFFRQAMLAATTGELGVGTSSRTAAPVVTEVCQHTHTVLFFWGTYLGMLGPFMSQKIVT